MSTISYIRNVTWYTVWDAKTDDLLASGTAEMCARRLGYANAHSFASSVCHFFADDRRKHVKYSYAREIIPRDEVDSLPSVKRRGKGKNKKPARVTGTDRRKG